MNPIHNTYRDPNNLMFEEIKILGLPLEPTRVMVNSVLLNNNSFSYNAGDKVNTTVLITARNWSASRGIESG